MNQETLNNIIRKKVIWQEIKAKEQEYSRLQSQIKELENAKKDISFQIQKKIIENEEISLWLLLKETEYLNKNSL